jgi:septum formation protein
VNELMSGRADSDLPCSSSLHGWIVLTGDQVVTHDGDILEKPDDIFQAKEFVKRYADSPPKTVGAVVITHFPSGIQVSGVDSATIVFQPSIANVDKDGKDLIDLLLEDDAPVLSCAGGLMVEHPLVREHLDHIEGTEDSVMGLSKDLVLRLLTELHDKLKAESVI